MLRMLVFTFLVCISLPLTHAQAQSNREQTTCSQEARVFWMWNFLAGSPRTAVVQQIPGASIESVRASDGTILRGVRLRSQRGQVRGYVLVIQGNATLATTLAPYLTPFQEHGFDVFVFDYRGFGMSGGGRRMHAIIADYRDIEENLASRGYSRSYLYAYSFGGIVAANAFPDLGRFRRVVYDGVPSGTSGFRCRVDYAAMNHLPTQCSQLTLVSGLADRVVRPKDMSDLMDRVRACGGTVDREKRRGHPFQNESDAVKRDRILELVSLFSTGP